MGWNCATSAILRQVAAHQKCIQLFPAGLLIVALAASDDGKAASFIKPPRRCVIFLNFKKYAAHASPCKMAEMGQQQISGQAAAAFVRVDADAHLDVRAAPWPVEPVRANSKARKANQTTFLLIGRDLLEERETAGRSK